MAVCSMWMNAKPLNAMPGTRTTCRATEGVVDQRVELIE